MKLFYEIAFKAVIRAVLSPLTPPHTLSKPPFHFDNFRTGSLCYEAEKATNSVFLLCCLQNGGDDLQRRVSLTQKRATGSRACTQVMPLCLLGSCRHFTGDHHCWDPEIAFCRRLMWQKIVCAWQRCDWPQNCTSKAASQLPIRIHPGGCVYVYTCSYKNMYICTITSALAWSFSEALKPQVMIWRGRERLWGEADPRQTSAGCGCRCCECFPSFLSPACSYKAALLPPPIPRLWL